MTAENLVFSTSFRLEEDIAIFLWSMREDCDITGCITGMEDIAILLWSMREDCDITSCITGMEDIAIFLWSIREDCDMMDQG